METDERKWKNLRNKFTKEYETVSYRFGGDTPPNLRPNCLKIQSFVVKKDKVKVEDSKENGNKKNIAEELHVEDSQTTTSDRTDNLNDESKVDISKLQNKNSDRIISLETNKNGDEKKIPTRQELNNTTLKRKTETKAKNDETNQKEKQKSNKLQKKFKVSPPMKNDDHDWFFNSLLPYVRQIPKTKILTFRSRVHKLVDEYAYINKNELTHESIPPVFPNSGTLQFKPPN